MVKTGNILSLFLFLLGFVVVAPVSAEAKTTVQATVDRNKVNEGGAIMLTVSVSSDQSVSASDPVLPSLSGFQLINRSSGTEARSTFSNGQFQTLRTRKFNYQLAAERKGSYSIGAIEVVVDGKPFKTKPITIQVLAGGSFPKPDQQQRQQRPVDPFFGNDPFSEMDDIFNQLLGRRGGQPGQPVEEVEDTVAIQLEIDKDEAYVGEQITASWFLYTRGNIREIDTLKYPDLNGFWKEDLHLATHLNFQNVPINGVVFKRALLVSYALFPINAGEAIVDPYKAKMTVLNSGRGFGFGRPQVVVKNSKQKKLRIKSLPLDGKPESFVGAVGEYSVSTEIKERTVKLNQPFVFKIRFDGVGNAKLIELPKFDIPENLELYDTKKESKFNKNGRSTKTFELLFIPRKTGPAQIPSIAVAMFNPKTSLYTEKRLNQVQLNVIPGENQESIPSARIDTDGSAGGGPEKRLPSAILLWSSMDGAGFFFSIWSALLVYGLVFVLLLWKASKEFAWGRREKDLTQKLKRRLEPISDLVSKEEAKKVGIETLNAVYFTLGEISGEGGANVEIEKLLLKMPPSVRRSLGKEIAQLIEKCQALGFAPDSVTRGLRSKEKLKELLEETEKILLKAIQIGTLNEKTEIGNFEEAST